MNRADYVVLLTLVGLAALALSWGARADGYARDYSSECPTWARMVERIEALPADGRDWQTWMSEADPIVKRYVLSARNWLEAGRTSRQAWNECPST